MKYYSKRELYALGETLGDSVTEHKVGGRIYGGGGKGGGGSAPAPAPSSQTVTNTSIPEYARPYVETMLGQSAALTDINQNPYQTYGGQRIAEFSPLQQQAMTNVTNMQTAGQLGTGTDLASQAGYGGLNAAGQVPGLQNQSLGYGAAGSQYGDIGQMYGAAGAQQASQAAQQAKMQAQRFGQQAVRTGQQALGYGAQGAQYGQGAVGMGQNAAQLAAEQGLGYGAAGAAYGQGAQQLGLSAAELASQQGLSYGAQGAQYGSAAAGLAPQAQGYGQSAANIGMGGLGYGAQGAQYGGQAAQQAQQGYTAGERFAQQATDPNAVQAYMSPYIEQSLAPQLKLLNQQQQLAAQDINAKAVGAGAFGGNRATLAQGLNAQNYDLARQQAIGQGYDKAFQNAQAQQQFGANLGLQGLQAGYQGTGMGITGAQTGLQGLGTAMQGQQAGLAGLGQAGSLYGQGMQGAQTGLQGLQGALAGTAQGLQGYQAGMQGAQTGLQGLQGALAGSAQGLQGYQTGMQGAQTGMQGVSGALAGYNTGLSGVGQQLGAGQLGLQGTAQGIQGAQAGMQGAQSGLAGVQGAIGAGQYGLAGLGTAGSAAGTLGQLGQTQFGQQTSINQQQATAGAVQQAQAQQALDTAYQDFMNQKNYPYQQLAFQSDMLRGLPLSQAAQTQYTAPPNAASQLGGLGMSALGIYGMSGGFKANGGMVGKGYATGGLMAAKAYKEGGYADGGDISMMTTEQLTKMLDNKSLTPMEVSMIQKQLMLRRRMAMNPKTSEILSPSGIDAIPTGDMVPPEGMAGGGIVAFAEGGAPNKESYQSFLENQVRKSIEEQMGGNPFAKTDAEKARLEQAIAARQERAPWEALAMAGLGTMSGTSQYGLENLGKGGTEGLKSYGKAMNQEASDRQKMLEAQVYADKAEDARKSALTGQMQTTLGQMYNKQAAQAVAGAGSEEKALLRVQALINQDDQLPLLYKQRDMYEPSDPKYKAYNDAINSIKKTYFEQAGIKRPFVAPAAVQLPPEVKEPGFFERIFGGSEAPKNKVVPFSQLPTKG